MQRSAACWAAAFAVLGAAIVAQHFIALSTAPPGFYIDEASIGYNAWAIAHHGVDEHGIAWPVYFAAFGEYKNPLYVYAVVPFVRFLSLTATTERLPAALLGLVAVLFLTLAAWRITQSRWVVVAMCVIAAVTPWLIQESRVGFEVITMVATLSVVLWCLAAEGGLRRRRFALAGAFLALSIFAYSTGRVEVALFTAVFMGVYARRRFRGWWLVPVVVAAGYAVLGAYALSHPGALTAEFNLRSIATDGAPLPTLIARFAGNYFSYFDGGFLFVTGDFNLRHNTGFAGMLLAATLPLLLLGLAGCWRRRHEALPRFVVLCLVVGPVAAAVVNNGGEPHALRSADMLPFWLVLTAYGLDVLRALFARHPQLTVLLAGTLGAAVLAQASLYLVDMYTAYPVRAASLFDDGLPAAVATAWQHAHGHEVFVSTTFEGGAAYIDADVALLPPPPASPQPPGSDPQLAALRVILAAPAVIMAAARPGDTLVLAQPDPLPAGAQLVHTEYGPRNPLAHAAAQPLAAVYRIAPRG